MLATSNLGVEDGAVGNTAAKDKRVLYRARADFSLLAHARALERRLVDVRVAMDKRGLEFAADDS
jgi:hypothetical protein